MTEPRKSTVFDYSDLRLHPNGTRVYQKSTNHHPKLAQSTVQVARSNWIATDAGGSAKVPLFKKRKKGSLEEEEDGNISASCSAGGEDFPVEVDDDDDVDKKGKHRSRRPDQRKTKRQKFLKSDDYLAAASPPNLGESSDTNFSTLPYPSPDLLKCIHRFTSEFYHERDQLLNSSRQFRKERKERRLKQDMDRESSPSSHSASSSESQSKSAEKVEEDPDEDASEDDDADTKVETKRRKKRKGRRRSEKLYVDMYKVFDGSAMMALGMLVQEHIANLLKPSIPEGWEGEIRAAYTDPWGDSPQLEDDGKDAEARQYSPQDGKNYRELSTE